MSHITDTGRRHAHSITGSHRQTSTGLNQAILSRTTGLIQLAVSLLNVSFILRFLVELVEAPATNPFAQFIRTITEPFLSIFQGLTRSPAFTEVAFELHILLAITVYSLLGWAAAKILRILLVGK